MFGVLVYLAVASAFFAAAIPARNAMRRAHLERFF